MNIGHTVSADDESEFISPVHRFNLVADSFILHQCEHLAGGDETTKADKRKFNRGASSRRSYT